MNEEIINFYSETDFNFQQEKEHESWLKKVIISEGKKTGDISFIFCNDEYLVKLNQEYLDHDTYTDIISFDSSIGTILSGDIFISVERVIENAERFAVSFDEELRRVLAHGVLHFCGYNDKSSEEQEEMGQKEEEKMKMFHVEQ